MSLTPTAEQQAIVAAFRKGQDVTVIAAAGAGKTSTLKLIANEMGGRRGQYIAFNKAIVVEAGKSFPGNVACNTSHSLAYRAVGYQYRGRMNNQPFVPGDRAARILRINEAFRLGDRAIQPRQAARLAQEAVGRFCYSDDTEIQPWHVPVVDGMDEPGERRAVRDFILPFARRAWEDLKNVNGQLRFSPDIYLKVWSLSNPRIDTDVILYDEAQDTNKAVLHVIRLQTHTQKVVVGDPYQAIYGWRGAVDAMDSFPGSEQKFLSKSFRFGPAIAREANKVLAILGAKYQVTGFERISSITRPLDNPDAILCRTNAQVLKEVMTGLKAGLRVALAGRNTASQLIKLAEAAAAIKMGIGTDHPELFVFTTWGEVQDFAEHDAGGSDLKVFVQMVDDHGPEVLIDTLRKLTDAARADVVIGTAHGAKGLEWNSVKIAADFRAPKPNDDGSPGQLTPEEARLLYVALTRAKLSLDNTNLAWLDGYVPGPDSYEAARRIVDAGLTDVVEAPLNRALGLDKVPA